MARETARQSNEAIGRQAGLSEFADHDSPAMDTATEPDGFDSKSYRIDLNTEAIGELTELVVALTDRLEELSPNSVPANDDPPVEPEGGLRMYR